jgi:hypothetical protein
VNKIRSHLYIFWRILNKNIWIKILIFSGPKILTCFYLIFSFLFLPANIHSPIFLPHLILSTIFFSAQSTVWSNHAFGPPTQFSLVIFNLQMPTATFSLLGQHDALCCVVRLRHRGAASPPPPLPLWKWPHHIASISPFSSTLTNVIKVPPPLSPSPWLHAFCRPTAL